MQEENCCKRGINSLTRSLSKTGQVIDRGELTKAGRALDKHEARPGSVFPKLM